MADRLSGRTPTLTIRPADRSLDAVEQTDGAAPDRRVLVAAWHLRAIDGALCAVATVLGGHVDAPGQPDVVAPHGT